MATIHTYALLADQLERVREAGGPLADRVQYPTLDFLRDMTVNVTEVDVQIVAYWVVWYALHAEPLHIREDYRKDPGVARGLIDQTLETIDACGERAVFATIEDDNLDVVGTYAGRLGFHAAPGTLFYLVPQPADPPAEG